MQRSHSLRDYEIKIAINLINKYCEGKKILEIGSGTGYQANILEQYGYDVRAIDIEESNIDNKNLCFPVMFYDGKNIPFNNKEFDIVFSSNVFEHIHDLNKIFDEIIRVLKDDGICITLLPTSVWVFYTILTSLLRFSPNFYKPHGAIAKTIFQEVILFRKVKWINKFQNSGFKIIHYQTNNLFYTGASLKDYKIPIEARHKLSRFLGSSCHVFVLKKQI